MLVDKNDYMTSGIYIGMKSCTPYMKHFVYKIREDGLAMFNLKKVDDRLKTAANFMACFGKILVVSRKDSSAQAIETFAKAVDGRFVTGRFHPGTLTNPSYKGFYEPELVLVIDPLIDEQVMVEARKKRIPIIAMCNTFNSARNVDLVIPMNNNGKKSVAIALWAMAREIMKSKGKIKKVSDYKLTINDFGGEEEE